MTLIFDADYFNNSDIGYREYQNYPHFLKRATWIADNLKGSVLVLGSAYGYLVEELVRLNIPTNGIDNSEYVYSRADESIKSMLIRADIRDYVHGFKFDWAVSWNVLESLDDISNVQSLADNHLHIICMSDASYEKLGYNMRSYEYYREQLPDAVLVDYDTCETYPATFDFKGIPLCWDKVSL